MEWPRWVQILRPTVVHVQIVYRWLAPFPIRYEIEPGAEAVMDLVRDEFDQGRLTWGRVSWTRPGNVVRAWPTWEEAVWDCRHGLRFAFGDGVRTIMRPLVKARLAEVVIGPHCIISYGLYDEQVWQRGAWPIPPRPAFGSPY